MMQPFESRQKKLAICVSCLEVNPVNKEFCSECNNPIKFANDEVLYRYNQFVTFYAYQQRITLEKEIQRTNGAGPFRHYSHIPYSEVIAFFAGAVVSGMTWDGIKLLIKAVYNSINRQKIVLEDPRMLKSGFSPDKELLGKLATDNKEFTKFVQYLEDYKNEMPDAHPYVREETKFIKLPDNVLNDVVMSRINKTVKKKLGISKKSK